MLINTKCFNEMKIALYNYLYIFSPIVYTITNILPTENMGGSCDNMSFTMSDIKRQEYLV